MLAVACVLLYLAIVKQFEPLLLLPIGFFGMLMTNLPLDGIFHMDIFINETNHIDWALLGSSGGMVDYIYLGVKLGIYPPLIFLGIGTMTDFEPLIARPSSLLLGAAAQLGIFFTFVGAKMLGFTNQEAGAIGIIGGADGPTAIYVTTAGPAPAGFHRGCGILLHGAGACYPAAYHEGPDHGKRTSDRHDRTSPRFQDREDSFSPSSLPSSLP